MILLNIDIVIVGGGPAGLAAVIEAKRHGCDSILVIDRENELGGILQQCIHSGFGLHIFHEELTGPEYAERFIRRLEEMNIDYMLKTTVLEITKDKMLYAVGPRGFYRIYAKAIILAMGCRERTRDAIQIPGSRPAGIITAGSAQRLINMEGYMVGKKVVILGSGDIGLIMARRLTLEGAQVQAVLEVMPYPGGLMRNIVQCLDDFAIPLLLNHTIIDIQGNQRVEKVVAAKMEKDGKPIPGTEMTMECDTLLLSVGLIPENELSMNAHIQIDLVTSGPMVNEAMETSIEGIFACGNVVHVHDLVDYVTEEAQKAGENAAKYIKGMIPVQGPILQTKPGHGIRHVVPQKIRVKNINEEIQLLIRADNQYTKKSIIVQINGDTVHKVDKPFITPSEMECIKINLPDFYLQRDATLFVSLVEEV